MKDLVDLHQKALKLVKNGSLEEAISCYKEIVRIHPNYEFGLAYYNLACCYENLKQFEAAKENYLKAIEYWPDYDIYWGGYASFLYLYGDAEEALEAYLHLYSLEIESGQDTSQTLLGIEALGKRLSLTLDEVLAKISK